MRKKSPRAICLDILNRVEEADHHPDRLLKRFHRCEEYLDVCKGLGTRTRRLTMGISPLCNGHLMGGNICARLATSPDLKPPISPTEKNKGWCLKNL